MIKWIGKHSYYTEPIEFITWGDKSTVVYIGKFTSISINCVMICDDYTQWWPSVVRAIDDFAKENKLSIEVNDSKAVMVKTYEKR